MTDPGRYPNLSRRGLFALGGAAVALTALPGCDRSTIRTESGSSTPTAPTGAVSVERPLRIYGDDAHPVYFRRPLPLDTPRARVPSFPAGRTTLRKGTVHRDGALPLSCDIVLERDVALKLRDGTTIYTDVFRPVGDEPVPALFGYSPYGKAIGGQWLDDVPGRLDVPLSALSELQRFERADPAYWVNHGYAVLNLDPRGVGRSQGDIVYWGRQLAEDGYDFVEWIASQPWSDGKVAMTGNSFLAVSQWFIAAERPPHLTAIAPWEGFSDHFREVNNRGGIPMTAFAETILSTFSGTGLVEDGPLMAIKEQFLTPYWLDKEAALERIDVPAYVVASWSNGAHTHGTFRGWRGLASRDKWLRVHNRQEWQDYHTPANVEELRAFFDHYLKGMANGWEATPRIRLSVLDPGGTDTVNRVEREFPLARTDFQPLYLTAAGTLERAPGARAGEMTYDATGKGVTFTTTFDADTELTGYLSLRLWVEARGADDMELAVSVDKLSAEGTPYEPPNMVTWTATGYQRVSQRRLDEKLSTPSEPLLTNTDEQPLAPGQIVPVDIAIWPMGMRYRRGEQLRLTIAPNTPPPGTIDLGFGVAPIVLPADGGTYAPGTEVATVTLGGSKTLPDFVAQQHTPVPPNRNNGTHVIHLGGQYDSHLLVPVVPPV